METQWQKTLFAKDSFSTRENMQNFAPTYISHLFCSDITKAIFICTTLGDLQSAITLIHCFILFSRQAPNQHLDNAEGHTHFVISFIQFVGIRGNQQKVMLIYDYTDDTEKMADLLLQTLKAHRGQTSIL